MRATHVLGFRPGTGEQLYDPWRLIRTTQRHRSTVFQDVSVHTNTLASSSKSEEPERVKEQGTPILYCVLTEEKKHCGIRQPLNSPPHNTHTLI